MAKQIGRFVTLGTKSGFPQQAVFPDRAFWTKLCSAFQCFLKSGLHELNFDTAALWAMRFSMFLYIKKKWLDLVLLFLDRLLFHMP